MLIYRKPDRCPCSVTAVHTCSNGDVVVMRWWHFEQRKWQTLCFTVT